MRWIACPFVFATFVFACGTSSTTPPPKDGGTSDASTIAAKSDWCSKSCTSTGMACAGSKPVTACCVCTPTPNAELVRATGLAYFSAPNNDPMLDLGCLDTPKMQGTPQMITMTGFVKLFSTGDDSANVKIEIFKEGANGALGDAVGTAVTTSPNDPIQMPKPMVLTSCPTDGCSYRQYNYPNVPTETPLIVKTSGGNGSMKWGTLYDYNVYIFNDAVKGGMASWDITAVAATDPQTAAGAAGGVTIKADRGMVAGEIHDCADVRLGNAFVNTDVAAQTDMFYFGENEANPIPDTTRGNKGTSKLGLFGAFNYPAGVPIRISATGLYKGQVTFLGTHVVQAYPGAVTALALRGRRPWQK